MRSFLLFAVLSLLGGGAWGYQVPGAEVETLAKATATWDGTPLPAYLQGQPEITVLRYRIAPGARLPLHQHLVINVAYMLKGELVVTAEDGRTQTIKAGDTLIELVGTLHYGRNDGTEPAELVVFYAGRVGEPNTVLKGSEGAGR